MPNIEIKKAWIGVIGIVVGAVLTGSITLIPWYFSPVSSTEDLRDEVEAGLRGLEELQEPERKLRQINRLEDLLKLDPAMHLANVLMQQRGEIEANIKARDQSVQRIREAELKQQERLVELERARQLTHDQAEIAKLEKEKRQLALAAERTKTKEKELEEARRLAEEKEAQRQAEESRRIEEERKQRIATQKRQIAEERQCLNTSCSSWIIR
jgi:hypothetical protein